VKPQFSYRVFKDGCVRVAFHGRDVVTVAGRDADRLRAQLEQAPHEDAEQLLLAKITGNFKRGNERR
jgi:hypothetical protein